ncbi:hypothetical protein Nepgr_031145 [Nepenthes gracilis]|uniref:Uncharacterized protein n=1 Tax=Nepenthes gracilis TaxID=150966 RepID=A0AAD3TGZ6_NEPGR|nr:hypothetical protein Nepgr_031145 [Nepenthes gracilis]
MKNSGLYRLTRFVLGTVESRKRETASHPQVEGFFGFRPPSPRPLLPPRLFTDLIQNSYLDRKLWDDDDE